MSALRPGGCALALLALLSGCGGGTQGQGDGGPDPQACQSRLDCSGRLGCTDGLCGRCQRDRDCLVTEFCHPLDQLCSLFVEGECALNQDCALGEFCVQGSCKPASQVVACRDAGDCAAGERCDPLNLVCVLDLGCNRDEDCAAGEVCSVATHRCESACTPATQEVICGQGLFCDTFGRCVECFEDDQCGLGLTCNLEVQRCEGQNSCLTSRDCDPGLVCNPQTRQCTSPPPACLSNADCPTGSQCDPGSGACVSAECRPDGLEPNDFPESAAPLATGRHERLNLCPGDRDFYALGLVRGDRVQVIATTDFLSSDSFQLVLLDPTASEVLQEGSLLLDHVVAGTGTHLVRVQTLDPQASYALLVTVTRGVPCDDDAREPDDSALQARPIAPGSYPGLALCPQDEDWYSLERPLGARLLARLSYPALQGDLDLDLVAGDGQTLVMRSATAGDTEVVYAEGGPGTRYYLRVYAEGSNQNRYQLDVELTAGER
ncbi:MAG TPA: hypothetical protein PK668_06245 [Myxococcota bacterium]|nr:hypothetical protein [Myxococcota bacterium]HRY92558.1 hypothetical protein [Myxococcota bacterium]HSA23684.1 hypothetical protein [Myxococcota bacterium]